VDREGQGEDMGDGEGQQRTNLAAERGSNELRTTYTPYTPLHDSKTVSYSMI
jgi:hypothetical protein